MLVDEGGALSHQGFNVVYGADGAYSAVRLRLQKTGRFDYRQNFLAHGYKELTIPAGADGAHQMDANALHIWPRGSHMMIALPNLDGTFTATLFWPFAGETSFEMVQSGRDVRAVFDDQFPDAVPLIPDLADQYETNPASSLVTIRCGPWHVGSDLLLIGDAAHAVVPFYGQGANAAMEDVLILMDLLESSDDRETAFSAFDAARRPQTDALADLAIEHYEEMRDHVTSRMFLVQHALRQRLQRWLPQQFTPLYSLVTFSREPYADAVRDAKRQDRILLALTIAMVVVVLVVIAAVIGWAT